MRREFWGEHVSEQGCVVSAGVNMWAIKDASVSAGVNM